MTWKLTPEQRSEFSRRGGRSRAEKAGREGMAAMGKLGGNGKVPPAYRSAASAAGARALNAQTLPELKREWCRKGGKAGLGKAKPRKPCVDASVQRRGDATGGDGVR